jgi:hypothetical protein
MAIIVVAGGTGLGLGKLIVQTCYARPRHKVIVLGSPIEEALNGLANKVGFIFDINNVTVNIPLLPDSNVPRTTMTKIGNIRQYVSYLWAHGKMNTWGEWEM